MLAFSIIEASYRFKKVNRKSQLKMTSINKI
jgi:hypothetical protein